MEFEEMSIESITKYYRLWGPGREKPEIGKILKREKLTVKVRAVLMLTAGRDEIFIGQLDS